MKIDFSGELKNINGETIKENNKPVYLKDIAVNAVLADEQGAQISGEEKLNRYRLAKRINETKGAFDLTVEDVVLVKAMVAKIYPPLFVGQIYELIERC